MLSVNVCVYVSCGCIDSEYVQPARVHLPVTVTVISHFFTVVFSAHSIACPKAGMTS